LPYSAIAFLWVSRLINKHCGKALSSGRAMQSYSADLDRFTRRRQFRACSTSQRDSSSHSFLKEQSGQRRPPSSRPTSSHASLRERAGELGKKGRVP